MKHAWFSGNIDFYNDVRYRTAGMLFWQVLILLKDCGMTHDQAKKWTESWGYLENEEEDVSQTCT